MKIIAKFTFLVLAIILTLGIVIMADAEDMKSLLKVGRTAIENDKYEEAVSCLGELLTISGNKSDDPKVIAFGSTVQAYGIIRLNNPEMNSMAKQYLEKAIINDPNWKFPRELLKKVE